MTCFEAVWNGKQYSNRLIPTLWLQCILVRLNIHPSVCLLLYRCTWLGFFPSLCVAVHVGPVFLYNVTINVMCLCVLISVYFYICMCVSISLLPCLSTFMCPFLSLWSSSVRNFWLVSVSLQIKSCKYRLQDPAQKAKRVDNIAKIAFPGSFLLFILIFFILCKV